MKKLIIKTLTQTADLYDNQILLTTFAVSTAKNGLGCEENSMCTPTGVLKVSEKFGDGAPEFTVFKARVPVGVWDQNYNPEDLVLTRILWLEGTEEKNLNTKNRFIYLHGTNHEELLGEPHSHGCIRLSNKDIIYLYDNLQVGDIVEIV